MKTLSLIAQKGGTGKTTLGIHLAVQAMADGLNVLLVDVDPQASASTWWQRRASEAPALVRGDGGEIPMILDQARERGFELVVIDTATQLGAGHRLCSRLGRRLHPDTACDPGSGRDRRDHRADDGRRNAGADRAERLPAADALRRAPHRRRSARRASGLRRPGLRGRDQPTGRFRACADRRSGGQ
jgi:hypothetical protein